jgi:hypothetical protein
VVVEGVLRRPLRLAALRVEVIGHAKEPSAAQTLFPLLRRSAVRPFLDELLPELADDLDRLAPLPRRALRRYVLPPALAGAAASAIAWALVAGPWALLLVLPAAAYGALRYRDAGWRAAGGRLAVRSLRIARTTVLAPARLRESQTVAQNPLQRRAGLADLEIAFGKRTVARVHHLEATTAFDSLAGWGRLSPSTRQTVADDARDPCVSARDLAPREPQHPPARERKQRIALAIGLEDARQPVVLVAVDLEDQPRVPPHEIDLDSFNAGVDVRSRQPMVVAEPQEALLLLAAGHDAADRVVGQHRL